MTRRVAIVLIAVACSPHFRTGEAAELGHAEGDTSIAFQDVTRASGLAPLLEAVAKLRTERDVSLTVIGKRKIGGKSDETITRLGLDDVVEFVTGVSDERIYEMYSESELAVVPSLYEGFSLPAIEAMSCGIPLVATSGGALP